MKKIMISLIVCLILIPVRVLANSGVPVIKEYEALVSNKNGAFIYEFGGKLLEQKLAYNQKIYIYDEYEINNEYYGSFRCDGHDDCDTYGLVKLTDITKASEEFDKSQAIKINKASEVIVSDKNGAVLYKGPSFSYDVVSDTIPYKTILKYQYVDYTENWIYTSFNGKEGWLFTYDNEYLPGLSVNGRAAKVYQGDAMAINDETYLFEYPDEEALKLEKIKLEDKFEINYVVRNKYDGGDDAINDKVWFYVSYNNKEGWVDGRTIALRNERRFVVEFEDFYLYSKPSIDAKTTIKMPFGTPLKMDYEYDNYLFIFTDIDDTKWYRIKYNDEYYWVNRFYDIYGMSDSCWRYRYDVSYFVVNDNNLIVYNEPKRESEQKTVNLEDELILKGSEVFINAYDGKEYLYVENRKVNGWILKESVKNYEGEIPEYLKDNKNDKKENDKQSDEDEEIIAENIKGIAPKTMAILCIVEAMIISLLGVFSFVYVRNKKKKAN